jgi:hypothetical protein
MVNVDGFDFIIDPINFTFRKFVDQSGHQPTGRHSDVGFWMANSKGF